MPDIPIPRLHLPRARESSPLLSPRESQGPWKQWQQVRASENRSDHHTNAHSQIQQVYSRAPRPDWALSNFHPFKLYNFPSYLRVHHNSDDWRRLKVRFGYVVSGSEAAGSALVGGTDLDITSFQDVSPSDEVFLTTEVPPQDSAHFVAQATGPAAGWHEFIVPDDNNDYYFWVSQSLWAIMSELSFSPVGVMAGQTNTSAYSFQSGNTGLTDLWPSFPDNDPYHTMIGIARASHGKLRVVQIQYDNVICDRTGGPGPVAPTTIADVKSIIMSGGSVRGEWANNTLYFVGDIVTRTDKVVAMTAPFQTGMPTLYAFLPNNTGTPAGNYGVPYGPSSGLDPLTNSPEPWKQLSSSPQVYCGTLDDPNSFGGPIPYDITKGALYYKVGGLKLYSWNTSALNWTGLIV